MDGFELINSAEELQVITSSRGQARSGKPGLQVYKDNEEAHPPSVVVCSWSLNLVDVSFLPFNGPSEYDFTQFQILFGVYSSSVSTIQGKVRRGV